MADIIIETAVKVIGTLLVSLIGVLGAWLTKKLSEKAELQNIAAAMDEVILLAQQTVDELQQTTVDGLKAAHEDGKLTEIEIKALGETLLSEVGKKMSSQATKVIESAGVDLNTLIKSAAEAHIQYMH